MIRLNQYDHNFSQQQREKYLQEIRKSGKPGILIHTCNRVEFYEGSGTVPVGIANHLFRVVSGLESFFLGETFIQGQVKEQYQQAAEKFKLEAPLHRLFQWAFLTGKRVRSETALSRGALSHSQAVVEIIKNTIPDYPSKRFAFIGINKLNRTIMNFLHGNIHTSFILCNRTFDRAKELETQFNSMAFRLDQLKNIMAASDIIITATSAPHAIIRPEHLEPGKNLTIFDLAVPADVHPEIPNIDTISYFNIEAVENQVARNIQGRSEEIIQAERIIAEELEKFMAHQQNYEWRKQSLSLQKNIKDLSYGH